MERIMMDNVLLRNRYVIKIGSMNARIDLTNQELNRVYLLLEKLDATNKDSTNISMLDEGGNTIYKNDIHRAEP